MFFIFENCFPSRKFETISVFVFSFSFFVEKGNAFRLLSFAIKCFSVNYVFHFLKTVFLLESSYGEGGNHSDTMPLPCRRRGRHGARGHLGSPRAPTLFPNFEVAHSILHDQGSPSSPHIQKSEEIWKNQK